MKLKFNLNWKVEKRLTEEKAKQVLYDCMLKMQELAINYCPVDTGGLKISIKLFPQSPGYANYILADGKEYGVDVEYGTSPHYVSAKELKDWARRQLGNENLAYPVAKSISKKGTNAQPFFRPALDQVKGIWISRYMKEI